MRCPWRLSVTDIEEFAVLYIGARHRADANPWHRIKTQRRRGDAERRGDHHPQRTHLSALTSLDVRGCKLEGGDIVAIAEMPGLARFESLLIGPIKGKAKLRKALEASPHASGLTPAVVCQK